METVTAKIISMLLLGGISLILGMLPVLLKRCCNIGQSATPKGQMLISALSCFGGGVILTTCFTHMLPEVNLFLNLNIEKGQFPDTGMAVAEILVLCGFFMIYIVEEVTHLVVHRMHSQKKSVSDNVNGRIPEIKDEAEEEAEKPMFSQHHDHEEVPAQLLTSNNAENQFQAALRGFLVILALSLHAVFEGIAMGLTKSTSSVWFLFFAISCHKYVIAFCCGMQFISSGVKTWLIAVYVSTFALISPIGVGIGIALSETVPDEASLQNSLVTILQGLATGTLLYVVFFEVIEKERQKGTSGLVQVSFLLLGCLVMLLMEYIGLDPSLTASEGGHEPFSCMLKEIDSSWEFPLNFTCQDSFLIPTMTKP